MDSEHAYRFALGRVRLTPESPDYVGAKQLVKKRLGPAHVCARQRLLYFKALLEAKAEFSPERLLNLTERYEAALAENFLDQWHKLKRDSLFAELRRRFPILLLTNETTRAQMLKLRALDPRAIYFSYVITSEELGVEKPAVEGFLEASRILKVPLKECAVVGNHWESDLEPAAKQGAKAFLTTEFSKGKCPAGAAVVLSKLDSLLEVI